MSPLHSQFPRHLSAPVLLLAVLATAWTTVSFFRLRTWQGIPKVIGGLLALAYLVWILWEGRISLRDAAAPSAHTDRRSNEVYGLAQGAVALSAWLWSSSQTQLTVPIVLGVGGFVAGIALRIAAIHTLGAFYSHRAILQQEHQIVDHGVYAWLRHPAYAGMLLTHLGLSVYCGSGVASALTCLFLLPAILWRITLEERLLSNVEGYAKYCASRARLVPGVW